MHHTGNVKRNVTNKPKNMFDNKVKPLINYYTYVLVSDADVMEGISYEAASIAGNLGLNKLIVLYDSNNVCLDGKITDTINENIGMRFISQGWNVISVEDGNSFELISKAIEEAKLSSDRPTIIEIKSTIGKYSELEGTNKVHGTPLSKEDISKIKEKVGIRDIPFQISQSTIEEFRSELDEHFELNFLIDYYLWDICLGLVDNLGGQYSCRV